ncbi:hypothetical protein BU16DRAFT_500657 [Lophium mytilinum]|uniref:DUF6590 domain-containing protein n=1 Tax=Lophium mytilinum TaxID=390894 RepID=A0A6A6RCP7_9PEZI|nr:hypothetical protein BU16DRAFT_500657 [Lophium mytilinum]
MVKTKEQDRPVYNQMKGVIGAYEELDPAYLVRQDARGFFKRGRVFSMLFTELMGETPRAPGTFPDNVSIVKYGAKVITQIRRFVVVAEKMGFCYTCPISTYGNRGTTKTGCRPEEHAIVYYKTLQTPSPLPLENGMVYQPIGVLPPSTESQPMSTASRIRFAKAFPIEWNVKVKDLGRVADEDMGNLMQYYMRELNK